MSKILKQNDIVSASSIAHKFSTSIKLGDEAKKESGVWLVDLLPANEKFIISIDTYGTTTEIVVGCEKVGLLILEGKKENERTEFINVPPGQKQMVDTQNAILVYFLAISKKTDLPVMVCLEIIRTSKQISIARHTDAQTAFS